ncbi:MAG TPA: hypothetical protein VME46_23960 [Acidimicrobiales bacterium]|nr:hypothetical protein [Acidimicrobiales bacterium]
MHSYYCCRNQDPLRAGGEHRRCRERNIRADDLDVFLFEQVRLALLPELLFVAQEALSTRVPAPDNELLAANSPASSATLVRPIRNATAWLTSTRLGWGWRTSQRCTAGVLWVEPSTTWRPGGRQLLRLPVQ